jgi:tetratricopeptide (TPR) repeat protein
MTDDKTFPCVKFGNSDDLKTGEPICVIGNPFGFEYTISQGIVSGIRDSTKEYLDDKEMLFERVIQTDAAVSPGNSGGAFFNINGEAIGITSYFYLSLGNLNFGIPINIFKRLIENSSTDSFTPSSKTKAEIEEKIEYYLEIANSLKEKIRLYELTNDPAFRTKQAKPSILPGDSSNTTININQDSLDNICLTKAEHFYNKCLGLDSAYFNTYDDLIDYYIRIKKTEKAEGLYEKAKKIFQNDHRLQYLSEALETFYIRCKKIDKIKKLYGVSDKYDQAESNVIYRLGLIYENIGEKQKAIKLFQQLIKKDSENYRAYFQIGKYYYESGFYTKARKYLESSYEFRISPERTRDDYRTALLEDSYSDFDLHYYLGMISIKQGNKTAALINYIKLNPSSKEETEKLIKLYKKIVN